MHKHFIRLLVVAGAVFTVSVFVLSAVHAQNALSWINSALTVQKQADTLTLPTSLNGNIDCAMEDAVNCGVPTTYGAATQSGTARLKGTSAYHPVLSYVDGRQHYLPIPNSGTAITYTTEPPYGFYLYFNYNFMASIVKTNLVGSSETGYKINLPPDGKLTDKNNNRLAGDYASISFSQNGQWMIVSEPNVAMLRVNLSTFEVLPFAPGFNYTIGLDPAVKTAITNDGRYAVVASKEFGRFSMYDLNTCEVPPLTINGPVACQSRDLNAFMQQQVNGYSFVSNVRFMANDTIAAYATYIARTSFRTARFIISAGNITNQLDYLALGDSYISGEGAFDYQGGTDTGSNGSTCHLSYLAYPYLLGKDLGYNSYHSVACSGAVTADLADITIPSIIKKSQARDRQDATYNDEIYSNFLPGYRAQLNFVSRYQPKVITMSIGGNDTGFSEIIKSCALPWNLDTCYSTYEDRLELVRQINSIVYPRLLQTYQQVKAAGPPDTRIYVVGYPQIVKPGGDCALNVHLNSAELVFAQQLTSYLNSVVQAAASRTGVFYVDTQDALSGHQLCEAKNGSVAINGLTSGNDAPLPGIGPFGNESFHPTELGYQLLENKILQTTHNLTVSMPAPNLSAQPPSEDGQEILYAPHSGRAVNVTQYDPDISDNVLFMNSINSLSINGDDHALTPGTVLQGEIHSAPIPIGSFTTDVSGNIAALFNIPASLTAGLHTIHFYGTDVSGQPIDIYKNVYVAASLSDWDGDGIADNTQSCIGMPASGQDYDNDGIDDACDGTIGTAPVVLSAQTPQNPVALPIQKATSMPIDSTYGYSHSYAPPINSLAVNSKNNAPAVPPPPKSTSPKPNKPEGGYADQRQFLKSTVLIAGLAFPSIIALATWKFRD